MVEETNEEKEIRELEAELKSYSEKDDKILGVLDHKKQVANLKKQIRAKKYAGVKRTGRNLKIIGKNIVIVSKAVGKGIGKGVAGFIGDDPNVKKGKPRKTVDEIIKELPK